MGAEAETVAAPGVREVQRAAKRLAGIAARTPLLRSRSLSTQAGAELYLKAENFQRAGAFKFRGAYNAVAALPDERRARGVCTVSSGNHAQALALAARLHGVGAAILMPADAPAGKVAATRARGAEIIAFDRYADDRDALARELAERRELELVHPYDNVEVIAGQGTVALEIAEDLPELDALVVPVGGGGLLAGCAVAMRALRPEVRLIGVEPQAGDDTRRSLAAGRRIEIPVPVTIADGQQVPVPGALTFPLLQRHVDEVVVASDEEIVATMRLLFERLKVVVEPSGACALAAVLAGRLEGRGRRLAVVLSGGNVDVARFARLTDAGEGASAADEPAAGVSV
jgi:threonine dehydratase